MADKKITELPFITDITASVGTAPANTTVIPVVLYGTTNQITADNLKDNFIREVRTTVAGIQTYTSSLKGAVTVRGNGIQVAGNLEVDGNVSVKGTLHTQYETSSVIYSSGSTKFGNSFDDLHEFTGSLFFTGSHDINGEDYTHYSSSNSAVFTDFSSSNSNAITSFSSSNSTLFTNFSSSNSILFTNDSSSASTLFTNFSSSNSSYNTTFSSSNATYITALSSSNSSYNTTFSSSNATYITALSSSNSTLFTNFSSSNSTLFTNDSSSASTLFTNYSSSNSTLFTNYSSSNSSYNTTFSSSNSTTFTNFSSSNSTTFTNYSSSTANSIAGLSSGVSSELARVYQTTSSLNIFTGSQDSRNFVISQFTASTNNHILGIAIYTSSVDNHIVGIATYTSSNNSVINRIEQATSSLNIFTGSQDSRNFVISQFTSSTDAHIVGIATYTSSLEAQLRRVYQTTSSLNIFTGSQDSRNFVISQFTSSTDAHIVGISQFTSSQLDVNLQNSIVTSSFRIELNSIEAYTASLKAAAIVSSSTQISNYYKFAETASANTFYNSQTISGSLLTNGNTFISGNLTISGSINSVKYVDFPQWDSTTQPGRLSYDSGEGTLTFGLSGGNLDLPIGVVNFETCFNQDSSSISKGEAVRVTGAQGNRVAVKKAHALDDDGSAEILGLAAETIGVGAEGKIITSGPLKGVDTSAYTEGQKVYLSTTAGAITVEKPQAPVHMVWLGVIQRVHASIGIINIKVQNGYEIEELHDVRITTASLADKQLLARSGSVWANQTISHLGIAETASVNPIMAYTASLKNAFTIDSNNDVYFVGKITTQELHTTYTTSSVLFQSGSTKFGNTPDDRHEFTGSLLVSHSFEVIESSTGATKGDFFVDSPNKYVYVGRQSATSGDNTTFIVRDRTNTSRATIPGGGSIDTIFTTNNSNFKVTNYSGTNLLNVSNVGNITGSGNLLIQNNSQLGASNTSKHEITGSLNTSFGGSGGLFVNDGFQKTFTFTTGNLFSIDFGTAEGGGFVDVTYGGVITSIGGRGGATRYAISYKDATNAVATKVHGYGDDIVSASISATKVAIFSIAGDAVQAAKYQVNVSVNAVAADGSGNYDKILYNRL